MYGTNVDWEKASHGGTEPEKDDDTHDSEDTAPRQQEAVNSNDTMKQERESDNTEDTEATHDEDMKNGDESDQVLKQEGDTGDDAHDSNNVQQEDHDPALTEEVHNNDSTNTMPQENGNTSVTLT